MNPQSETSSINSTDRQSLLKAWSELDVGFSEGPIDYLWLFYTAFYTAKGIPRAKSFYVTRLSIWKEPAIRMSFFHEYLVATIKSDNRADKQEYYLLFERTAGQLNTDKRTEENLSQKAKTAQEGDERRNGEDVDEFSFAPDRNLEDTMFGAGPQHWSHQSDDEGGPKSASTHGSASPQSEGVAGMLGMFFAAKDLASNVSESSSRDLILADDRYQLIDRPYRKSSDIEVAWITLGRPDGLNTDPVENVTAQAPAPTSVQASSAAPNPSSLHGGREDLSQHDSAPAVIHRTTSKTSIISSNASETFNFKDFPISDDASNSLDSRAGQAAMSQHKSDSNDRPRTTSDVGSILRASRDSRSISAHGNKHASVKPSVNRPSFQPDQVQAGDQPPPTPNPSPNDIPESTFLDQLPFAASNSDVGEAPITSGPLGQYLNTHSLSTEAFQSSGHPLLRVNTNVSNVTRSSRWRLRRRSSFSTIQYDSLPPPSSAELHLLIRACGPCVSTS